MKQQTKAKLETEVLDHCLQCVRQGRMPSCKQFWRTVVTFRTLVVLVAVIWLKRIREIALVARTNRNGYGTFVEIISAEKWFVNWHLPFGKHRGEQNVLAVRIRNEELPYHLRLMPLTNMPQYSLLRLFCKVLRWLLCTNQRKFTWVEGDFADH